MENQKRIFIGSFIHTPELFEFYHRIQSELTPEVFKAKWTLVSENLHITFHFFGEMPVSEIKRLQKVLQPVLQQEYPVYLELDTLSFFKRKHKPSVLYLNVIDRQNELQKMYHNIQNLLFDNGFIREKKDFFKPHITLARIKQVTPAFYDKLNKTDLTYNKLLEIKIIESILKPNGALYKELKF